MEGNVEMERNFKVYPMPHHAVLKLLGHAYLIMKSKSDETMSNASGRFLPPEHFSSRKASRGLRKVIIPLASTINYSVTAEFL